MSEPSNEMYPQMQMNDEEQQEGGRVQEEHINTYGESVDEGDAADKETQAKVQSVFQQVRSQIRSQVGVRTSKSSIMELVNRLKERQSLEEDVGEEKNEEGKSKDGADPRENALRTIFEKKLEDTKMSLRDEFEKQLSQVRKEMQTYTDRALKELECKMQMATLKEHEGKSHDKKQKPPATTLSRRGRALTRTMTTIIPKTCASIIVGPRARSETLTSSKGENSRILPTGSVISSTGSKSYQNRKPLPPACPPWHQSKTIRPKPKVGEGLDSSPWK